ncbi:MAG TPA: host-nuclease inhibitor Gam family protein [Humisphaera sp.]|nr:host-nuclease inhibitor Gam family protein [Humisphaera sp.]
MNELTELTAITNDELIADPPVPEGFHVHDEASANWVVRKITEARAYARNVAEFAAREKNRAQREEAFFMFRYGAELLDYARRKIAAQGGRRKSVNLPAGVVGFRHEGPKLLVDDEAAVIAWAKQHNPELVKTIENLSKSALNQHMEETGEVPDVGIRIEPAGEKFYIR